MPTWPSPAQGPLFYDPSICDACMSSLHFVGGSGTGWLVPRFGTQPSDDRARSVGTCKSSRISLWDISSVRLKSWNDTILSQFRYITLFFFFVSRWHENLFKTSYILPASSQPVAFVVLKTHTIQSGAGNLIPWRAPERDLCIPFEKKNHKQC